MKVGDPCGSKTKRVIDVLKTTEVPQNGHVEIRASPSPKKVVRSAQPKCSNAHRMGNRRSPRLWYGRKIGIHLPPQHHGQMILTNCRAAMGAHKSFSRNRHGRRGREGTLYVRECLDDADDRDVFPLS